MKIALLFPMREEAAPFLDYTSEPEGNEEARYLTRDGDSVLVYLTGVGKVATATAVSEIILSDKPDAVLMAGSACCLTNTAPFTVFLPLSFSQADFDFDSKIEALEHNCFYEAIRESSARGLRLSNFISGDFFLEGASRKKELYLSFEAEVYDMESAAAAYVCTKYNVPFYCIRIITDNINGSEEDFERNLPEAAKRLCDALLAYFSL